MSNIEIYKPNLPAPVLEVYNLLQSAQVRTIDEASLFDTVHAAVQTSFALSGFKNPGSEDIQFMAKEIVVELKRNYPTFRKDEILLCFRRGVLKEFGEYMGLSVASFVQFILLYSVNNARMQALAELHKPKETKPEPTDDEKFSTARALAMTAYNDVKANKEILIYGRSVYDFLDPYGLFQFSIDDKKGFYAAAKENLIREKQMDLAGKGDAYFKKRLKDQIKDMETETDKDSIKARAKVLALENYLQSVIFEETDFYSLLAELEMLPGVKK